MNRKCLNVIAILSLLAGTNSQAQTLDDVKAQLKSQPYMLEIPESNTTIFNQYCVGDATSANIPQPNYENPEVVSAAKKITETKTIANARLNNVQQKEFLQNLSYMKETVQQLISSSNEPVLVTAAQTFLAEISKADVTSISPEAAAAYKDMKKASLIKIKKAILGVAPKLETELNGVDVNKFKVLIDNLEKQINIELKAYDQTSAVGIIASFNSVIQKQIKPINISVIVKIAQQLLDIEVSAYGKELEADITIAQKTAKEFLSGNQNNSMPAGDMYYYLQNFDGALSEIINKTQDQVFTQMYASVKEESQKLDMTSLSTGMANLAQYSQIPTGDEYEQFKNEMEDVRYYLDDAIAKNVLVFSQEEQKSYNQFLQLNTSMSFYDALDLIKTIKASLAKNTDKENTSAYDTASSLSYTIPKIKYLKRSRRL